MPHSVFDDIHAMRTCPFCGEAYAKDMLKTIADEDEAHLVHIACAACKGKILAYVFVSQFGMSSIAVCTDLTHADAARVWRRNPVSEDEMLAFHVFLEQGSHHVLPYFLPA
ncbi:MAG: hypothetical protein AAB932_02200 [Patescibacteria group bacterium]